MPKKNKKPKQQPGIKPVRSLDISHVQPGNIIFIPGKPTSYFIYIVNVFTRSSIYNNSPYFGNEQWVDYVIYDTAGKQERFTCRKTWFLSQVSPSVQFTLVRGVYEFPWDDGFIPQVDKSLSQARAEIQRS